MLVVRVIFKAFALTGRKVDCWFTQGECPGLGASAPSGRVGWCLVNMSYSVIYLTSLNIKISKKSPFGRFFLRKILYYQ